MSRKSVSSRTFQCVCGHLAYWVSRRGWMCFCSNPRQFAPGGRIIEKASKPKGPLTQ